MRYFMLMSSFLLISFSAAAEYVRQEQRPDYFIPEREIAKTPVFFNESSAGRNYSAETVAHISAKDNRPQERAVQRRQASGQQRKSIKQPENNKKNAESAMKSPRFQKIYDEYHQDILQMKKNHGKLPVNKKLQEDLNKMSGEEIFEVVEER